MTSTEKAKLVQRILTEHEAAIMRLCESDWHGTEVRKLLKAQREAVLDALGYVEVDGSRDK